MKSRLPARSLSPGRKVLFLTRMRNWALQRSGPRISDSTVLYLLIILLIYTTGALRVSAILFVRMCVCCYLTCTLSIGCVHLSRGFFRPRTSIKQCLCYLSSVIALATKNVIYYWGPLSSLCDVLKKKFVQFRFRTCSCFEIGASVDGVCKDGESNFTETSANFYKVVRRHIPEPVCVRMCVYYIYLCRSEMFLRPTQKYICNIAAPLLLQPHEGCSQWRRGVWRFSHGP
jgi:hypothetical protein